MTVWVLTEEENATGKSIVCDVFGTREAADKAFSNLVYINNTQLGFKYHYAIQSFPVLV